MSLRADRLTKHIAQHYMIHIQEALGDAGVDLVKRLHPALKRIYAAVDYASISGSLTVLVAVEGEATAVPLATAPRAVSDIRELSLLNRGSMTLQLLPDGDLLLWHDVVALDALEMEVVAYTYSERSGEQFWVGGSPQGEPHLRGYPLFGLPSFKTLEEALARYAHHVARSSQCAVLQGVWREPGRVMWHQAPETELRRSLFFYLRNHLEGGTADVNEEAPADDKNPVDLTVRWAESNRIGLIEVKWLGASGRLAPPNITKRWPESRAQKALKQLANYLDLTRSRAPYFELRGYLVVFDARRRRVKAETTNVSREDGLAFENAEITYNPKFLSRHDIAPPVRCFCEPNWVTESPSAASR